MVDFSAIGIYLATPLIKNPGFANPIFLLKTDMVGKLTFSQLKNRDGGLIHHKYSSISLHFFPTLYQLNKNCKK